MLDEPPTKVPASWSETSKFLGVATFLILVVGGPVAYWLFEGIAVIGNFDFPVPDDSPMPATVELPPELLYDARYWGEFPLYWHRRAPGGRDSDGAGVFRFETPEED